MNRSIVDGTINPRGACDMTAGIIVLIVADCDRVIQKKEREGAYFA